MTEVPSSDVIHAHAMSMLKANIDRLGSDGRFSSHARSEILKAAYFRGYHEKACQLKGEAPDFDKYDAMAANLAHLAGLPDVADLDAEG